VSRVLLARTVDSFEKDSVSIGIICAWTSVAFELEVGFSIEFLVEEIVVDLGETVEIVFEAKGVLEFTTGTEVEDFCSVNS
jgi:hypothetical protein